MSRKFSIVIIVIFCIIIASPYLMFSITGELSDGLDEKRELAEFPTELVDDYGALLDAYFNDHAPYRNTVISGYAEFMTFVNGLFNKKVNTAEIVELDEISYFDEKGIYREKLNTDLFYGVEEENYKTCKNKKPNDLGFQIYYNAAWKGDTVLKADSDWMFLTAQKNFEYYVADNLLTKAEIVEKAAKLKQLQDVVIAKGNKIFYLLPPNKEQVYQDKMTNRSFKIQNDFKRVDRFAHYINTHTDINLRYVQKDLLFATNDNDVYYRYDAHWNPLGAYIGTRVAMEALGFDMPKPNKDNIITVNNSRRDLSDLAGISNSEATTLSVSYKPEVTYKLLFSEKSLETFTSSDKNGKSILVIGDSFRENMREYVAKDFETTTFVHYYHLKEVYEKAVTDGKMKPLDEYDYIIVEAVERYDENLIDYAVNTLLDLY